MGGGKEMKAGEIAKILNEFPEREVYVLLGSFRADKVKEITIELISNEPAFFIKGYYYKQVETKGIDYV
jgi:hypothetical protein